MDKIQAFLITAGRKDLAQEYYLKTANKIEERDLENLLHKNKIEYHKNQNRYAVWDEDNEEHKKDLKFENKVKKIIAPYENIYVEQWLEENQEEFLIIALESEE